MVGTFNPRYTYKKRGVFYFCKTIPADLRRHYKKPRITHSLRTKSKSQASRASQEEKEKIAAVTCAVMLGKQESVFD